MWHISLLAALRWRMWWSFRWHILSLIFLGKSTENLPPKIHHNFHSQIFKISPPWTSGTAFVPKPRFLFALFLPVLVLRNLSMYTSKDGSIWQLFVLCLLALRDTVPKCYFYYSLGHPWKGKSCQWCQHFRGPLSRDNAILSLRYPILRDTFLREVSTPPKRCDTPPLVLSFTHAHLCDTPFCNVSRDNVRYHMKTSTKQFCDTIATSVARYEKYRYWASKCQHFRGF